MAAKSDLVATTPLPETDGTPNDSDDALGPLDLSYCDNTSSVAYGTLCAIKPSAIDARTKDQAGTATVQDQVLGFGYHTIAIPNDYDPNKGLWIHFSGTGGRPYNPRSLSFSNATWINEILSQGYLVIQLAYDNKVSVNETCIPNKNRNDCAGEVREEILTGVNLSPFVATDIYNSVDHRLKVLLTFLKTKSGVPLASSVNPNNFAWDSVMVSGHSQGGNLSYYIAKNRGVKFACMLGSPYDVADDVNPGPVPIADWFSTESSLTPVSRLGQLVTVEDENYTSFRQGALFIGMTYGQEAFEISLPPYQNASEEIIDGHAASVGDPNLASLRAQACFRL